MGRARKSAVGDEGDRITQAFADECAGHAQHLAHPRTTDRPFVTDHHDVAGRDLTLANRGKGRLFTVEDARRSAMH